MCIFKYARLNHTHLLHYILYILPYIPNRISQINGTQNFKLPSKFTIYNNDKSINTITNYFKVSSQNIF